MKNWERIRNERLDLTDYVIHFTRDRIEPKRFRNAREVLIEILESGHIRPTFAPMRHRYTSTPRATVKGPFPAVCLTEQPLSAVLTSNRIHGRYSGYGIAYHKVHLYWAGGGPVLYGSDSLLGRRLRENDVGYEEGKDKFVGGLPDSLQYLWANYAPALPGPSGLYVGERMAHSAQGCRIANHPADGWAPANWSHHRRGR